jgi:hypothetical protein
LRLDFHFAFVHLQFKAIIAVRNGTRISQTTRPGGRLPTGAATANTLGDWKPGDAI